MPWPATRFRRSRRRRGDPADSRDSPHLFGIGLREMLADEITADLRAIRASAAAQAAGSHAAVTLKFD